MILSELILSKISEKNPLVDKTFPPPFKTLFFYSLSGNKRFFKLRLQEHHTDVLVAHPL